jgi:carboxylesterase type B
LCLNITIPTASKGSTDPNAKLPVFVFIHGGAFMVGSGIYPQYDMARFVRLSVQEGKPCIGVTMKYAPS